VINSASGRKAGRLRPDQRIVTKTPRTELWDDTGTMIGKIARPKTSHIVQDVQRQNYAPRLAAISNHMDTGDITTLAKPDIVEQIREQVQGR